mmetsp:Transcript_10838/g.26037  ORF Transcript_10838/g.26037 Transcript_10838/m.26037 type:complete len:265 (+) Transcript_10838:93-887(+)
MNEFPYTIEDEPAKDWTVEHVLQWWLLRAHAESEAQYDTIVEGLSKQLEEGKKEIWEAHEQVSEIVRESEKPGDDADPVANAENQSVNHNQMPASYTDNNSKRQPKIEKPSSIKAEATASKRPVRTKKPTKKAAALAPVADAPVSNPEVAKPDTIHVDIVGGPYDGKFYDLQPKTRNHAWVGRSSSAKFKDRGISLPLDLEVSTSHGRFEFKQGKFYYTDVASTNGTRINGEDCVPNQPYPLAATGATILVGQTPMKVTLLKLA